MRRMIPFPSNLSFASFLQYASHGSSPYSKRSKAFVTDLKNDSSPRYLNGESAVGFAARRLSQVVGEHDFLKPYFAPSVILMPAPKSTLLLEGALWPPDRICTSLLYEKLGGGVLRCIERKVSVRKSAVAHKGERPSPEEHYHSIRIKHRSLLSPKEITVVDDVITRGSTFIAIDAILREAFPDATIRYFAMIRTESNGDITSMLDPVEGTVTFIGNKLIRRP